MWDVDGFRSRNIGNLMGLMGLSLLINYEESNIKSSSIPIFGTGHQSKKPRDLFYITPIKGFPFWDELGACHWYWGCEISSTSLDTCPGTFSPHTTDATG